MTIYDDSAVVKTVREDTMTAIFQLSYFYMQSWKKNNLYLWISYKLWKLTQFS